MTLYKAFYEVLTDLADLFDAENRIGGHTTAQELRAISQRSHTPLAPAHSALNETIQTALSLDPHPIAAKIKNIMPLIDWHNTGLDGERIAPDIAGQLAFAELVGPDGMIFSEHLRVGLFVQAANVDYVARVHGAEETLIVLGGKGYWQVGDQKAAQLVAGDTSHHASMTPHRSLTTDSPVIAAWRWSGDIGYDTYSVTD